MKDPILSKKRHLVHLVLEDLQVGQILLTLEAQEEQQGWPF
jgi:hypothetical protein